MAFTLTHIRTGELRDFSVREILELLGDPINNEIVIRGESYRIDDVRGDIGGGGNWRADWQKIPIPVIESGQTQFAVNLQVGDPEGLFLAVNGAIYEYGIQGSFHLELGKLIWHGRFSLEPSDHVYIKYIHLTSNSIDN